MPSAAAPLSIWDLFQNADFVVKFVMIGLLVASVAVWAIAIDKVILYPRTRRAMRDWSDQISMNPGDADWENRPPDSANVASCAS